MKVPVRTRVGRRFFLTFSFLDVPLLAVRFMTAKTLLASAAQKGDGCMKDTDHYLRHPRVDLTDLVSAGKRRD
jgi:hypothetical protein